MANIDNPHNIKSVETVDLPGTNQMIMVWCLKLLSASDTFTVPGLENTSSVASITTGITAAAGALTEGQNTITVTGGTVGATALITTAHRKGLITNLSRDEDPT
jgi:hypothetical protein